MVVGVAPVSEKDGTVKDEFGAVDGPAAGVEPNLKLFHLVSGLLSVVGVCLLAERHCCR